MKRRKATILFMVLALGAGLALRGIIMKRSMKLLSCTLVAVAMSALLSSQAMAALYATGVRTGSGTGSSALYTVDPSNGASSLLWTLPGDVNIYNGGLAYDAGTDRLYATGFLSSSSGTSRLFSIDRHTGATTAFGGLSSSINLSSGGLAINPLTGVMYATGNNGYQSTGLFTIDKTTGAATLIGQSGGQCCTSPFGFNINGLGFGSDGTLWANGFTLTNNSSHLFTLDLATGLASDVGAHGVNVGRATVF